jgi:lysophospholipase L1-like esterase
MHQESQRRWRRILVNGVRIENKNEVFAAKMRKSRKERQRHCCFFYASCALLRSTSTNMLNLVFIGDSLTQWFDWQRRFPDYHVVNLGISGETVEGLLARRERIRLEIDNPDFIFLMTGINNIANEQYDITASYREIVRNLTTWHKKANVVVQSILPVEWEWIGSDLIKDINRRLEQIAREYHAEYLDVYRSFVDSKGMPKKGHLSEDGVHLAAKGYEVWSHAVEKYLKKSR